MSSISANVCLLKSPLASDFKFETGYDTETDLIRPAHSASDLVVVTWHHRGERDAGIVHHKDPACYRMLREWFEDAAEGKRRIVGQNIAFDNGVVGERFPDLLPVIFAAYNANAITDTMIRQWLLDNAAGHLKGHMGPGNTWVPHKFDLETLARRLAGMYLQKDAWRLSYGAFADTPLCDWPKRALEVQAEARIYLPSREELLAALERTPKSKQPKGTQKAVTALKKEIVGLKEMIAGDPSRSVEYPKEDATATLRVCEAQEAHAALYLKSQYHEARSYFALHLQSAWGLRTDRLGVDLLRKEVIENIEELRADLVEAGLVRENGKKDTKAAKQRMIDVCRANNMRVIRTKGHIGDKPCPSMCSCGKPGCREVWRKSGHVDIYEAYDHPQFCREHVAMDKDACEAVAEYDVILESYSKFTTLSKVLTGDLVALAGGIMYPVHTRYGFAGTGRTTSSGPNIQNQSKREGIREAFVARGYGQAANDHDVKEAIEAVYETISEDEEEAA